MTITIVRKILVWSTVLIFNCHLIIGRKIPRIAFKDHGNENTGNLLGLFKHDLKSTIEIAEDRIEKLATFEKNIQASGLKTEKTSPAYGQMIDFLPSNEAINNSKSAFMAVITSQQLVNKYCWSTPKEKCSEQLSAIKLYGTKLGDVCSDVYYSNIKCDPNAKYRSSDGSCNNLKMPAWGKSNTAYRRLIKSNYDDGIYALRKISSDGHELPSPRSISVSIADSKLIPEQTKTQAMSIWGLLIGHDMAHTPASNMVNIKTPIMCCTNDGRHLIPRHNHISCAPISIPITDVFYKKYYQMCMNYVRSLPAMRPDCSLGPTEQMNQASHLLDGSVIYGSTKEKSISLRAMWNGRLTTSIQKNGNEYPPLANRSEILCHLVNKSDCYKGGDSRVNSQPQLSALHTIFIREHNLIADQLAKINDHWDDERLYQETKRIVIAEIQHITYAHWLPLILGKRYMKTHKFDMSHHGFSDLYNNQTDPTVSNEFATAGLPFINSMINGDIGLYIENRNVTNITQLKHHFVKMSSLNLHNYLDNVIRGLATQNSQKIDVTFSDALTRYLYSPSGDFGMDLLSLDIQKGRDHGIPGYVHFRKVCNLTEIFSFKDLIGIIAPNTINRLQCVYKKVADIDLVVGAVSELPVREAMVGPTLQCIIGEQFLRTKTGDRFFYDNSKQPRPFSKNQLEQIRRSSLARIFCDNSNDITWMQKDVFLVPNMLMNELLNCHETAIPFMDLSLWKEDSTET